MSLRQPQWPVQVWECGHGVFRDHVADLERELLLPEEHRDEDQTDESWRSLAFQTWNPRRVEPRRDYLSECSW